MTHILTKKRARIEHANKLIKIISEHGRRFFYCKSTDRTAHFSMINGRVYLNDDHTGKAIHVRQDVPWKGFSHGGTLKALIEAIAHYIRTGNRLGIGWIGPERTFTDGNIWGYPKEAIESVRMLALGLPIFGESP